MGCWNAVLFLHESGAQVERWSADLVKGTAAGSAMALKEADGQSGRAERRGAGERTNAFEVVDEGEEDAADDDDDEDAWRVARMVASCSFFSCWIKSKEQRGRVSAHGRAGERERERESETQQRKKARKESRRHRKLS